MVVTRGDIKMGKNPHTKNAIEGAIMGLKRELDGLAPKPRSYTPPGLARDFNGFATRAWLRDAPRRLGLERRIERLKHGLTAQDIFTPAALPA